MGKTHFSGPIKSGTIREGSGENSGTVVLSQSATFDHNQVEVRTPTTIVIPAGGKIIDIILELNAAWNSATSDSLEIGTATDQDAFGDVADIQATGKVAVTADQAQVNARDFSFPTDTVINTQVSETGASASAGSATLTVLYIQR